MTTQQIQLLVLLLPPNSPYFHRVFGLRLRQQQPSLTERLQVALNDPALLWNIVQSYGEANLPLPQFQWPASIWRAYEFVTDPECIDESLTQAQELQTPERWAERDLIRALLMCPDATDERIAEVLGLDVEVIQLFEVGSCSMQRSWSMEGTGLQSLKTNLRLVSSALDSCAWPE